VRAPNTIKYLCENYFTENDFSKLILRQKTFYIETNGALENFGLIHPYSFAPMAMHEATILQFPIFWLERLSAKSAILKASVFPCCLFML
jgi:hypothetical protein